MEEEFGCGSAIETTNAEPKAFAWPEASWAVLTLWISLIAFFLMGVGHGWGSHWLAGNWASMKRHHPWPSRGWVRSQKSLSRRRLVPLWDHECVFERKRKCSNSARWLCVKDIRGSVCSALSIGGMNSVC